MKINVNKINSFITWLILLVIIGGGISCFWLSEAQRIIVGSAVVLALINLLCMRFFLIKNNNRKK